MNAPTIDESYKLLNVIHSANDDEIIRSYRMLALRYHPDKNRDKIEWATKIMSRINSAYTIIMTERFRAKEKPEAKTTPSAQKSPLNEKYRREEEIRRQREEYERQKEEEQKTDQAIERFANIREAVKESLYRFFQYNLYNIARREQGSNRGIFNEVVASLRKNYHRIEEMIRTTADEEVLEHLNIFSDMIFNFYRAAECLNVPDRYDNVIEIEAFRMYRRGEESLHKSHREVFFTRHNRGSFERETALLFAREAVEYFRHTLKLFPESTWAVETGIKLDYTESLIKYINLFFEQ
jgi:hypothetical protein